MISPNSLLWKLKLMIRGCRECRQWPWAPHSWFCSSHCVLWELLLAVWYLFLRGLSIRGILPLFLKNCKCPCFWYSSSNFCLIFLCISCLLDNMLLTAPYYLFSLLVSAFSLFWKLWGVLIASPMVVCFARRTGTSLLLGIAVALSPWMDEWI